MHKLTLPKARDRELADHDDKATSSGIAEPYYMRDTHWRQEAGARRDTTAGTTRHIQKLEMGSVQEKQTINQTKRVMVCPFSQNGSEPLARVTRLFIGSLNLVCCSQFAMSIRNEILSHPLLATHLSWGATVHGRFRRGYVRYHTPLQQHTRWSRFQSINCPRRGVLSSGLYGGKGRCAKAITYFFFREVHGVTRSSAMKIPQWKK